MISSELGTVATVLSAPVFHPILPHESRRCGHSDLERPRKQSTWLKIQKQKGPKILKTAGKKTKKTWSIWKILSWNPGTFSKKSVSYLLVNVHITMENHHVEWVNPLCQGAIFNSYVTVYQRVPTKTFQSHRFCGHADVERMSKPQKRQKTDEFPIEVLFPKP